MSKPDGRDLARVLSRKAEGDAKAMRFLAPNPDIDDESIGFHAQQAIEKWIKADGVPRSSPGPEARSRRLLDVLAEAGIEAPPGSDWLNDLSIYAVPMRYDDRLDLEPLDRGAVVALVDEVGAWAARLS